MESTQLKPKIRNTYASRLRFRCLLQGEEMTHVSCSFVIRVITVPYHRGGVSAGVFLQQKGTIFVGLARNSRLCREMNKV